MDQKTFDKMIAAWKQAERESVPVSPSGRTKDCLSFAQCEKHVKGQSSPEQKRHVDGCRYCQRTVRLFEKHVAESVEGAELPELNSSYAANRLKAVFDKVIGTLSHIAALLFSPAMPVPFRRLLIPAGLAVAVLVLVLLRLPSKEGGELASERKPDTTEARPHTVARKYAVLARIERLPYVPLVIKGPVQRTEPERLFDEGMRLYSEKEYPGAIQKLQMVVEKNPKSVDAHFYLGLCRLLSDSTDKAIEHLRQATTLGGSSMGAKAYWYLGNAYLLKEDGESASVEFETVVKMQGDYELQARERIAEIRRVKSGN